MLLSNNLLFRVELAFILWLHLCIVSGVEYSLYFRLWDKDLVQLNRPLVVFMLQYIFLLIFLFLLESYES